MHGMCEVGVKSLVQRIAIQTTQHLKKPYFGRLFGSVLADLLAHSTKSEYQL
jgi:hypothetical protein